MIRTLLPAALLALGHPALAQAPEGFAGLYAGPGMPVETCRFGHLQLYPDGQLIGTGMSAGEAYLCRPGTDGLDCLEGELVEGALTVPRRDGTTRTVRVGLDPAGSALRWDLGAALPRPMERCGPVEALPSLALPDDPPPARVDEAALDASTGLVVGGAAEPGSLPLAGLFGALPDDPMTRRALRLRADPGEAASALDLAANESLLLAACQAPMVLTEGGRIFDVSRAGEAWTLRGMAECRAAGDGIAECRRAKTREGGFTADPDGAPSRWTFREDPEATVLCREGNPGCAILVPCPAESGAMATVAGGPLADLVREW